MSNRTVPYYELCAELYKRGNYKVQCTTPWGYHHKQEEVLKLLNSRTVTNVGYGGSARNGKSWVASEDLTMKCIGYPGTGWGLARKELKNLRRTTLMTLFKVFRKYKLEVGVNFKYNQQDQIITFYNGSQIFLIDTAYKPEDPMYTRFGGYELTGITIDESNETPYQAIEILFGRCGFRKNIEYDLPPRMFEMFNPDKGHVYNRFYLPYRNNTEPEHTKFIKALPSDNPDPAVKIWIDQQIATASEITIERLVNGNFEYDDSNDKMISQNAINDYFKNEHVKPEGLKYITADIARAGKDSTVVRVWHGLVVIQVVEFTKSKINETVDRIKKLAIDNQVPMSRVLCDEDGVGGGVVDYLDCFGFINGSKPIGHTNYQNLKAQCYFEMASLINDARVYEPCSNKILIDTIKQEMDWVRERGIDDDGKLKVIKKDDIKQGLRRSPDHWDSIMMRAYFELGMSF